MIRMLMWCLLGLVLVVTAAHSQAQKAGGPEKTVEALEQQWLQGQKTNNPEIVAPLLSEKIVVTEDDGKVHDKAGMLDVYKKTKWNSADYTDVKVTSFGNTAIATGSFKGKGTDEAGKPFDVNERWTDTWVKAPDGKWQCVASQATPVK